MTPPVDVVAPVKRKKCGWPKGLKRGTRVTPLAKKGNKKRGPGRPPKVSMASCRIIIMKYLYCSSQHCERKIVFGYRIFLFVGI